MTEKAKRSKFPPLYWLVVVFEFFERGSYYGMMSILSVYMVDELQFAKQDVGLIKGTIQPLLYFLPILAGALADRFGFRRMLLIAFSLLGSGYFLTSQATGYAPVFLALVVMGLGAGTFKPIISGTIARCTDESNSTLGFGIFYWSINLGAFLFPLILVPLLRDNIGYEWVIVASAIGTGVMLLPTIFAFREPPKPPEDEKEKKPNLFQTLANAFEIIYSEIILLGGWMRRSTGGMAVGVALVVGTLAVGAWQFIRPAGTTKVYSARVYSLGAGTLTVRGEPNLCSADPFVLELDDDKPRAQLKLLAPERLEEYSDQVLAEMANVGFLAGIEDEDLARLLPERLIEPARLLVAKMGRVRFVTRVSAEDLKQYRDQAVQKTILDVSIQPGNERDFVLNELGSGRLELVIRDSATYQEGRDRLLATLGKDPRTAALTSDDLDELADKADKHPFLLLYCGILLLAGLVIQRLAPRFQTGSRSTKFGLMGATLGVLYLIIWLLPGMSLFARVLTSVLSITLLSLYAIDYTERERFHDHFRFLFMILIYSGFWVLYFQMFDSVLWYVQAYVDPTSLNQAINSLLQSVGIEARWRFDVEIVTVINAFTIILLQLLVSSIVKNFKALPTMIAGITLGTIGMAILAISTGIWVFMFGIIIFSIGEMTAHPKFIAYVGMTAPKSRVAMYMGYLFLYGVIGSSIGGVVGANLYVKYVDELNQPRTLWLIFACIGVATIIGLLLYNRFVGTKGARPSTEKSGSEAL